MLNWLTGLGLPILAGLAIVAIILLYAVIGAIVGRRENEGVDRTAERAGDRIERATGGLLSVGRVALATGFSIVIIAAQEGGTLVGELGSVLMDFPLIASNIAVAGLGYAGLNGILSIGPVQFVIVAGLVFVIGVAISNA
ncbi:hypothetical protein [Halorhabdus salina]|uniref:hypothetical protein n=1 Tax=Halorhabdus salina TaxID=2750670 RepID=UPI0015EE7AEE|nr:hypothetical protein [Halorhabdus salina]